MKNNFLKIILIFFFLLISSELFAEELKISSSEINLDKKEFKLTLKGNVKAVDKNSNSLETEEAEYFKKKDLLNSLGPTIIKTSQSYIFESKNVIFDNKNKIIKSDFETKIIDPDGNIFMVEMFNYNSINNIFFSKGNIKLKDKNDNIYKFSELYFDEKKKKIVGSDAKMFFNDSNLKSDPENNPRLFANSLAISEDVTSVQKGVFTFCKFRENDKCPPWELRAKKIHHNSSQKKLFIMIVLF